MTGKRITGRLGIIEKAVVGKTIVDAVFEESSIAMRFADGTWLYIQYDGEGEEDFVSAHPEAEPWPYELHDLGVIDAVEMDAMRDEKERRIQAEVEAAERDEFERLRVKFEGTKDTTP